MPLRMPVLLVHGIWDDGSRFDAMRGALDRAGIGPLATIDLVPNDGSAPIETLAEQVEAAARALLAESGRPRLDLVGFSMGALVARFWIQRRGGASRTRRFVSISGPHAGTATAWAMGKAGVRQMRPKSPLLCDLDADPNPWRGVEVHTLWTPFDLMIVPPRSSRLAGAAHDHRIPLPLHRSMVTHPRAIDTVVSILRDQLGGSNSSQVSSTTATASAKNGA
jgi:triacylglycerol esterase/lipase EstA (alpha/beta hydrolase family)